MKQFFCFFFFSWRSLKVLYDNSPLLIYDGKLQSFHSYTLLRVHKRVNTFTLSFPFTLWVLQTMDDSYLTPFTHLSSSVILFSLSFAVTVKTHMEHLRESENLSIIIFFFFLEGFDFSYLVTLLKFTRLHLRLPQGVPFFSPNLFFFVNFSIVALWKVWISFDI